MANTAVAYRVWQWEPWSVTFPMVGSLEVYSLGCHSIQNITFSYFFPLQFMTFFAVCIAGFSSISALFKSMFSLKPLIFPFILGDFFFLMFLWLQSWINWSCLSTKDTSLCLSSGLPILSSIFTWISHRQILSILIWLFFFYYFNTTISTIKTFWE